MAHNCFLSDKNGPVIAYAIIVAEDYLKPTDSKPILPKWQDVQQFSSWIPYQVSDPQTHLFTNATEAEVVVGTDNCNQVKTLISVDYMSNLQFGVSQSCAFFISVLKDLTLRCFVFRLYR